MGLGGTVMNKIPCINVGNILEMKKSHPCGSKEFTVNRVGSDIKLTCLGCGRSMTLERIKVEKMIKKIIPGEKSDE